MTSTKENNQAICERLPFWIDSDNEPSFCCLHLPNDRQVFKTGVVVCNPLGYEYSHTHRTIRHLCDNLAADGYPCIRFDYHGTGDSFSNLLAAKRIETFVANIGQVVQKLKDIANVSEICLIGIRLGATLAAAFSENTPIDKLVLWSPCIKGRAYVREMKALEKLASHNADNRHSFIDSGGFIVTEETADELSKINLLKQEYLVSGNALVIERDDFQSNNKLIDALTNAGIKQVEHYAMAGYNEMMAEPHATEVPIKTIRKISTWLTKQEVTVQKTELSNFSENLLDLVTKSSNASTQDQICYIRPSKLLGILSTPVSFVSEESAKPLIILVNSGSVHRVGPNRTYVELSRSLVDAGYPTFRFDLSQLGDSITGQPFNENNPYSHDATNDIESVLKTMSKQFGFKKYVISGLCSGAHNSFHAGLNLPSSYDISEVILINPLTFYKDIDATNSKNALPAFQVEQDSDQYKKSILDPQKWKKLISGNVDLKYLRQFVVQKSAKVVVSKISWLGESLGVYQGEQLSRDLKKYKTNKIKITFFIASKDPGKRILMSQSKKTVNSMVKSDNLTIYDIPNADHTFSSFDCRNDFIRLYTKHIVENYS